MITWGVTLGDNFFFGQDFPNSLSLEPRYEYDGQLVHYEQLQA